MPTLMLCQDATRLRDSGMTYQAIADALAVHYTGRLEHPSPGWAAYLVRKARDHDSAPEPAPVKSQSQRVHLSHSVSPKKRRSSSIESVSVPLADDIPDGLSFEEFLDIAQLLQQEIDQDDPIIEQDEWTLGDGCAVGIVFVSCAHLGGRYTNHAEVKQFVNQTLSMPNLYWAALGDDIEGYLSSFRAKKTQHEQALSILAQLALLRKFIHKLAKPGRLLMGTTSQHGGKWFENEDGHNPIKAAYLAAGVPWFDGQAYIKLHVGPQVYKLAVSHEFPGHSMYNQLHPHIRALHWDYPMADVVVQGDKHKYAVSEITAFVREYEAGHRASPYAWLVQTGTAKTGPDPYTIKRWPHGIMEWPVLIFDSETHNIEETRHWRTVRAWLEPQNRAA